MTRHLFLSLALVSSLSFAAGCASTGDATDDGYLDAQSDATSPGSLDLWQSTDGQWRYHVVSGNGRTLLTSEGYTSRTGAIGGVLSTLENGVDPVQYQLNQTASGAYNVRLYAANHEIIGWTQAYSSKSNATRAIGACVRAVTSYLDHAEANTTGARVEVTENDGGQFRFTVFARNGEAILGSEVYGTRAGAYNGAFASQEAAARDGGFTVLQATDSRYYFVLRAANGEVVGTSQMYTARTSAEAGIASVKSVLPTLDLL